MQSQTKQTQARGRAPLQMDLFPGDPQKAIDDGAADAGDVLKALLRDDGLKRKTERE